MISMSGAFSVTFSVIFAYVADVTDERERSTAYGLVGPLFGLSSTEKQLELGLDRPELILVMCNSLVRCRGDFSLSSKECGFQGKVKSLMRGQEM